jgi:hypothetical protein
LLSKRDDTFTGTATRVARCASLLEGLGLLSSQLMGQARWTRGFLHGSGRRSIAPYVHERSCIAVWVNLFKLLLDLPKIACLNSVPAQSLYSSRSGSYIVTLASTCGPRWLEPYTISRVLMARCSKWCLRGVGCVLSCRTGILCMVSGMAPSCWVTYPL